MRARVFCGLKKVNSVVGEPPTETADSGRNPSPDRRTRVPPDVEPVEGEIEEARTRARPGRDREERRRVASVEKQLVQPMGRKGLPELGPGNDLVGPSRRSSDGMLAAWCLCGSPRTRRR